VTCSLLQLLLHHFVWLLTNFRQNISSSGRENAKKPFKKALKFGRFRVKFSPWRWGVGKKWLTHLWKEIYRRFQISNQIFGSISGSGDIARSLDTTFCRFWPKSQLCGWISREPDFAEHAVFAGCSQTLCTIVFNQKKMEVHGWFPENVEKPLKNVHFCTLWMNQFFFENRASSLLGLLKANFMQKIRKILWWEVWKLL